MIIGRFREDGKFHLIFVTMHMIIRLFQLIMILFYVKLLFRFFLVSRRVFVHISSTTKYVCLRFQDDLNR